MNKLEFREVRDFGQLVSDTFVFIKQNWKPLLKCVFMISGFFLLASMATGIMHQFKIWDNVSSSSGKGVFTMFGWEYFLNLGFLMIASTLMGLTTFSYISLYVEKGNQQPEVEEVWGYVKYFFWRFLGTGIVLSLLLGLGLVLCILPGLYLVPAISIMMAMVVFENAGLGYVFDRGFKLVKGNWWPTFGAIIIIVIVTYALMMVLILPASILTGVSIAVSNSSTPLPLLILLAVLQHLCQVFAVLIYVVTALAYFSLVEKKEGVSLLERVNMIGRDDTQGDLPEEQY